MTNPADYKYWRAELKAPGSQPRNEVTERVAGYWRADGARTKPSWPVAVWYDDDGTPHHKVGNSQKDGEDLFLEFLSEATWLRTVAVPHAEYLVALDTGRWPSDGKHARHMDAEEKLDIIPGTPSDQGGNMPEGDDDADQFHAQIKAKLEKAQAALIAIGKIDTEDKATKAAAQIEILREAGKLGEAKRKIEKAPHDAAAAAVQTKWVPVLTPASEAIKAGVDGIDKFQKAERARLQAIADEAARVERARLQAIADEEARVERERLQAIADAEAAAENERRQAEAEKQGAVAELVEAEAVVVEAEQVKVAAPVVEAPRVSTAYGRAVSKATVRKGRITDEAAFIRAIKGQDDFKEFLQDKANKLARAKAPVKGMEVYEE